jgi:hypothetical protein
MKTIRQDSLQEAIVEEVKRENLDEFSKEVDTLYKTAIEGTFDFSAACEPLVSENVSTKLYNRLVDQFPSVHMVLASIVKSRKFQDLDTPLDETDNLHRKQKMILHIFYAALRTHSNHLLKYWACHMEGGPSLNCLTTTKAIPAGKFFYPPAPKKTTLIGYEYGFWGVVKKFFPHLNSNRCRKDFFTTPKKPPPMS